MCFQSNLHKSRSIEGSRSHRSQSALIPIFPVIFHPVQRYLQGIQTFLSSVTDDNLAQLETVYSNLFLSFCICFCEPVCLSTRLPVCLSNCLHQHLSSALFFQFCFYYFPFYLSVCHPQYAMSFFFWKTSLPLAEHSIMEAKPNSETPRLLPSIELKALT